MLRFFIPCLLFSLNVLAQGFSKIDSSFGGASRPSVFLNDLGFVVLEEDLFSLGTTQIAQFDHQGNLLTSKSYDYWVSDSSYRSLPCVGCLYYNGQRYFSAQTEFVRSDSAFVRFAKFDKQLDTIFTKKHLSVEGFTPDVQDWVFDSDSTFIVTGHVFRVTHRAKFDLWIGRFDTSFNPLWELRIPDSIPDTNGGYFGTDVEFDKKGNIIVAGYHSLTNRPTQFRRDESFVITLNRITGQIKWFKRINKGVASKNIAIESNSDQTISAVRFEALNYIQNSGSYDKAVLRFSIFDSIGKILKDTIISPIIYRSYDFLELISTADGNLYFAGEFFSLPGKYSIGAYKFSSEGDSIWFRNYYHLNDSDDYHGVWAFKETPDSGFLHLGTLRDTDNDIKPNRMQYFYMLKTDQNGCVVPNCHTLGLAELTFSESNLSVFPNPSNGFINLKGIDEKADHFQIIDSGGNVIHGGSFYNQQNIYIKDLKSGLYFLVLRGNGIKQVSKFFRE